MADDAIRQVRLTCPKCSGDLLLQHYPERDAYRCDGCQGLWLPMMAHEHLEPYADELDVGAPRTDTGPETRSLACPQCQHAQLIKMVDSEQPSLHFESCKECYGRYYDAGEFRQASDAPSFLERLFGID